MKHLKPDSAVLARRALACLIPVALWAAGAQVPILGQGILFLAPFFLLLALWTAGVDPEPILRRIQKPVPKRPDQRLGSPQKYPSSVALLRGGLLLAASLAGRAPPVARAVSV